MKLRLNAGAPEEGDSPSPFFPEAIGKIESVFEEGLPSLCRGLAECAEAEISVSFLSAGEIREVNKSYRGIDEPTDVLSFPLWEEGLFAPAPPLELLPLGDILICPEEAERHGLGEQGSSRREVLCLLLAHGFLHLLGWNHDTPEREDAMKERQESLKAELLRALGEEEIGGEAP